MKYNECGNCWNDSGLDPDVREHNKKMNYVDGAVAALPRGSRLADSYRNSGGACWTIVHEMSPEQRVIHMLNTALMLLIDYKRDPSVVHKAFTGIDEYRYTGLVLHSVGGVIGNLKGACRGQDPGELWVL